MSFIIVQKKENFELHYAIKMLKLQLNISSERAFKLIKDIDRSPKDKLYDDQDLQVALKDFYEIQYWPEQEVEVEKWPTEKQLAEAEAWRETLTDQQKEFVAIIIAEHSWKPPIG